MAIPDDVRGADYFADTIAIYARSANLKLKKAADQIKHVDTELRLSVAYTRMFQ